MTRQRFDRAIVGNAQEALDFKDVSDEKHDITEPARLQGQLAEESAYNRGLIEASLDGLITIDPLLTITDVNATMCRMSGFAREELVGAPFQRLFTDPEQAGEGVRLTFERGEVTNHELTLRTKDQIERLVSFNAIVFKDQAGAVRGIFASARDITDKARLQKQLAEVQAYTRGLIEASGDGLVTVDESMNVTDVNEAMCRMVGRARAQLVGSPFPSYFTEPTLAVEGVRLTFEKGSVTNHVLNLQAADGRERPVSFNAAVFRDTAGLVRGIFASARDITAQKALEEQLKASQFYTRSLIESNIDALMTTDPRGIITDVNQQMETLTGHTREQLVGTPFRTYFTDSDHAEQEIRQVLREGRVTNYELTARSLTGRETIVSYNAVRFNDASGNLQGVFAAARDITEQKKLENQLRDSQFYTRSLIESNIDALMTTDALGLITDVNQQMEALTGQTREELIGSPFKMYFTDSARAEDGIRQVLREGRVTNYELTARSTSGLETVVSYNAITFNDQHGTLQGVFAAARDMTELRRFEQRLQEKNLELENANFAKDRFLATMSHELRTPLNAIIGFTGTLLMKLPGPLTPDQDSQLRTVQASGRHLLSLINGLLDLAKIESGTVEVHLEDVTCQSVIDEVAATLSPLAEAKGLAFSVEAPASDVVVKTDRRALSQIVINLTNNAIKFTEKGSVRIEIAQTPRNGSPGLTEIRIADTGAGIRAEDKARLFQAFEQLESTAARRHEGTGLGLHLSQKLAALVGGRITFESEQGRGSTFTLVLPEKS
jgi:PAS domain S-box-containing protein